MKTGKVLVTDLSGHGNRIFKAGDSVNEDQFPSGNWDKLTEGGYIKEDVIKPRKLKEGEMLEEGELPEGSPLKEGERITSDEINGGDHDASEKGNGSKKGKRGR